MESWKEELYHYGIKGMKWRQRIKENAARNYEISARQALAARDQALNTAHNINTSDDVHKAVRQVRYANKLAKNTNKRGVRGVRRAYAKAAFDEAYEASYNRTKANLERRSAAAAARRKERRNKISSAANNTKSKAQSYISRLFKKNG